MTENDKKKKVPFRIPGSGACEAVRFRDKCLKSGKYINMYLYIHL